MLLVGAGLYFTIRTRCVQLRRVGLMAKMLFGRRASASNNFSPFQAFCVALSGRVGTGNIVGVATAIALGGPGAVFWMWVIAFLGASTAFTESTLAQIYNFKHKGELRGGPASYIEKGLKKPWLGMLFAILTLAGYGMLLVLTQANGVSSAFENSFAVKPWVSGAVLAFVLSLVIIGGAKRIANVGVKRGLFSNEAGQGGGAIVSASAENEMPAQQGLVQAFSVYIDTILVCTATALMILCTGNFNVVDPSTGELLYASAPELGSNYVGYTQAAIDTVFHGFGSAFVAVALSFFVFTTLMAYYFYAESSIAYLFSRFGKEGGKAEKAAVWVYRIIMLTLVVLGACTSSDIAWKWGDVGLGLTTWINVLALLFLFPQALAALKDVEKKYPIKK